MLLIALVAAALVGFLLWFVLVREPDAQSGRPDPADAVRAPDDDPVFLRQLGERLRREGEDPPRRR